MPSLAGEARWFPEGSLAELPDIDADPGAFDIRRFELPHLGALQFVCEHSLSGGVTTSLALDAHGKSLSFALLEMEV